MGNHCCEVHTTLEIYSFRPTPYCITPHIARTGSSNIICNKREWSKRCIHCEVMNITQLSTFPTNQLFFVFLRVIGVGNAFRFTFPEERPCLPQNSFGNIRVGFDVFILEGVKEANILSIELSVPQWVNSSLLKQTVW